MVSVVTVVTSCSFDVEWQDAQHSSEIIIRPQTAQRVCWLICTPCVLPCHPALRAPLQRRGMGCLRAPHCGSALCGVNCTACVLSLRDCLRKVFNKIIIISSLLSHLMLTSYSHHTSHITRHSTTTTAFFAVWRTPFGRVMVYSSPFLEMVAFSEVPRMVALPVFTGFSVPVKV